MATIDFLLQHAELADSPSATLDAELLLAAALGKSRSYLRTWPEREVASDCAQVFAAHRVS
jgi:release factor glutamine methyltransferase